MTRNFHRVWNYVSTLAKSDSVVFKSARFGLVGVLSGGVFSTVTALMAGWGRFDPKLSAVAGYALSIPLNFVGNRRFSFLSQNGMLGDLLRYAALHLGNILLITIAMGTTVDAFHLNYAVGIAVAVVLIPVVNFAVMNWWVFKSSARRRAAVPGSPDIKS